MKKIISMALLGLAALVVGLFSLLELSKLAASIGTTSIQSCELPIAEKFVSVSRFGSQMTTFVVIFNDQEYTLPHVSTDIVRTYSEGDTLPVLVYNYENGCKLQVDIDTLEAVKDKKQELNKS